MGTILSVTHLTMRFGQRSVIKPLCSELHVDSFVGAEVVFNPQSASLTGQPYALNSGLALGRQSDLHTLERIWGSTVFRQTPVSAEHIWKCGRVEAEWQVSKMSNPTKLVLGGIALMIIGVSAFFHSLASGGGYGGTLIFIAGGVMCVIGCVTYFLKKLHKTP
jgi:hypothetical protein